jgi:hypothetical protein
MISKNTARLVYNAYSEIESAEKMLLEMREKLNDEGEFELKDMWGNSSGLELRIPTSQSSHTIKRVPFDLAVKVIKQHIVLQNQELERLETVCEVELTGITSPNDATVSKE